MTLHKTSKRSIFLDVRVELFGIEFENAAGVWTCAKPSDDAEQPIEDDEFIDRLDYEVAKHRELLLHATERGCAEELIVR